MIINFKPFTLLVFLGFFPCLAGATEEGEIDYNVEHLFEAIMDGRYLAFPEAEYDADKSASRIQLGYLNIATG